VFAIPSLVRITAVCLLVACNTAFAAEAFAPSKAYEIQSGDVLEISVWNEKNLQREVLVRPDGGLSFPLVGSVSTVRKTVEDLQKEIATKLQKYIPDASVSVAVKQINGNKFYVLGKVNRPGEFPLAQKTDVVQALAMAGGTSTFAEVNSIKVLRRQGEQQFMYDFRYGDIEKGKSLEQNIGIQSGDVVIVP